ncbi:MAG TPA: VWA domain-containing protein, partial [Vicinamibacterales bacterium]|nr:VWA domain-containing protein [Vicinamibacterales bacterium]
MMKLRNRNQVTSMGAASRSGLFACGAALCALVLLTSLHAQQQQPLPSPPPQQAPPPARPGPDDQGFRFKSGVELINVTATVSDASGRFVSGLRQDDFVVYEDDKPVNVTHFSADRVPVSLGIALDTSGSMAGSKIQAAQDALDRFLYELLDKEDEIFLYRFSNVPMLLQGWT